MVKKRGWTSRRSKRIAREKGEDESLTKAPHSIIVPWGDVPPVVKLLAQDYRQIMSPYTAEQLKVKKYNSVKDFVHIAPFFNVTHLVMFTKNESSINMKICRLPRGPSICFKVDEYSLIKDVTPIIKGYKAGPELFLHHSLLVMNNFNRPEKHLRLVSSMFQNMFPSINVTDLKVKTVRRVTLVSYEEETDQVEIRQYSIRVVPHGISRPVSKLLKKKVPNLGRYQDVSDFLLNPEALSESEGEFDGDHNTVDETQVRHKMPRKRKKLYEDTKDDKPKLKASLTQGQSAIRLKELGPRLTLTLYKIEGGLLEGDVLYNKFVSLTEKEKAALKARKVEKMKVKIQRRQQQETNIKKKKIAMEALKATQKKSQPGSEEKNEDDEEDEFEVYRSADEEDDDDDDNEYYRQEVGKQPEKGLFTRPPKKKSTQRDSKTAPVTKKRKQQTENEQQSSRKRGQSKWKLSDQKKGKGKPASSSTGMSSTNRKKFIRKKSKK